MLVLIKTLDWLDWIKREPLKMWSLTGNSLDDFSGKMSFLLLWLYWYITFLDFWWCQHWPKTISLNYTRNIVRINDSKTSRQREAKQCHFYLANQPLWEHCRIYVWVICHYLRYRQYKYWMSVKQAIHAFGSHLYIQVWLWCKEFYYTVLLDSAHKW